MRLTTNAKITSNVNTLEESSVFFQDKHTHTKNSFEIGRKMADRVGKQEASSSSKREREKKKERERVTIYAKSFSISRIEEVAVQTSQDLKVKVQYMHILAPQSTSKLERDDSD